MTDVATWELSVLTQECGRWTKRKWKMLKYMSDKQWRSILSITYF